jgi:hypothetical protein
LGINSLGIVVPVRRKERKGLREVLGCSMRSTQTRGKDGQRWPKAGEQQRR